MKETISLDEIEKDLWLGNASAAQDLNTLRDRRITHIVTLNTAQLPKPIRQLDSLTIRHVHIEDTTKADILNILEELLAFVREALAGGTAVLVHCQSGVSRSAAIVIGHLMAEHQIDYETAFERVRAKRPSIGPNVGFEQQLELFGQMGWRIDAQHVLYKAFQLRMAGVEIRKYMAEPADFAHLVQPDNRGAGAKPKAPSTTLNYTCRKCRCILATDAQHFQHIGQSGARTYDAEPTDVWDEQYGLLADIIAVSRAEKAHAQNPEAVGPPPGICKESIFVEPLAWMQNVAAEREGKLNCPKCATKVGSFNWSEGCECPCGVLIAPAFYLVPSKVELSRTLVLPRDR